MLGAHTSEDELRGGSVSPMQLRMQGEGPGPRTSTMHTTCPLVLALLAAAPLVFGQLLWVSGCFTGSFGIFDGFF